MQGSAEDGNAEILPSRRRVPSTFADLIDSERSLFTVETVLFAHKV